MLNCSWLVVHIPFNCYVMMLQRLANSWQINFLLVTVFRLFLQEAQLMLTNPCDAFRDQSRSPNILPFHMLGILLSCAMVTLSLRRARFSDIRPSKKCHDLEIRVRGYSRSLKVVPFDRLCMVSY